MDQQVWVPFDVAAVLAIEVDGVGVKCEGREAEKELPCGNEGV